MRLYMILTAPVKNTPASKRILRKLNDEPNELIIFIARQVI